MTLYDTMNDYFMAHQPAFMLGLIVFYAATVIGLALADSARQRRINARGM